MPSILDYLGLAGGLSAAPGMGLLAGGPGGGLLADLSTRPGLGGVLSGYVTPRPAPGNAGSSFFDRLNRSIGDNSGALLAFGSGVLGGGGNGPALSRGLNAMLAARPMDLARQQTGREDAAWSAFLESPEATKLPPALKALAGADKSFRSQLASSMLTGKGSTDDLREYQAYRDQEQAEGRKPLGFLDYQRALKGSATGAPKVEEFFDPESGMSYKATWNPATGQWDRIGGTKRNQSENLTSTDKKAIFEAEDSAAVLKSTLDTLDRAAELNDKTFTGWTAGARGWVGTSGIPGSNLVLDKGASEATREWENVMSAEAIKAMSATLKGATTDRELAEFQRLLSDPSTPPQIRARTIARMRQLAERQLNIAESRMKQLRGGDYYKQGGGVPESGPRGGNGPPVSRDELEQEMRRRGLIR